jgi:type IX secretion system PorP/SprF family membrane protein
VFGYSQQLPTYSLYGMNKYILNPAFAGSNYYWDFSLMHRSQWVGFDNGPSTQLFSSHSRIDGTASGFGGHFYNDRNGVLGNMGAHLSYSYHADLSDEFELSFGFSASYTQYRLSGDKVTLNSTTDNLIQTSKGTSGEFNGHFGTAIYGDNFYFGISALNLISPKMDYFNGATTPLQRHYYMQTGGWVPISANGSLQPSVIVDYLPGNPIGIAGNVSYEYVDIVKGGIGYRWKDAITFNIGCKIFEELYLNYAYDIGISQLSSAHSGSHEVLLTYNFYYNPIYQNNKARYNLKFSKRAD